MTSNSTAPPIATNDELIDQIGQLTAEIRLLRGDLFHYFELMTRTTNFTSQNFTTSTTSSSNMSQVDVNHEGEHMNSSSSGILMTRNHLEATDYSRGENNDNGKEDEDDDDDDDEDEKLETIHVLEPRVVTSCENRFVSINSADIASYICETGRLVKSISFTKISKKRHRRSSTKSKDAGKKTKLKRLDYIHSIHNCVTKHFRLQLIREFFDVPSMAFKHPDIFTAVQFIVGVYMEIFSSFKYTGLDASVIRADLKENIRDTLRTKKNGDRSPRLEGPFPPPNSSITPTSTSNTATSTVLSIVEHARNNRHASSSDDSSDDQSSSDGDQQVSLPLLPLLTNSLSLDVLNELILSQTGQQSSSSKKRKNPKQQESHEDTNVADEAQLNQPLEDDQISNSRKRRTTNEE